MRPIASFSAPARSIPASKCSGSHPMNHPPPASSVGSVSPSLNYDSGLLNADLSAAITFICGSSARKGAMKIHLKNQSFRLLALGFAASMTLCGGMAIAQSGPYHVETEWKIGGDTSWDYLAIDPVSKLLYVTHGDHVVVI